MLKVAHLNLFIRLHGNINSISIDLLYGSNTIVNST